MSPFPERMQRVRRPQTINSCSDGPELWSLGIIHPISVNNQALLIRADEWPDHQSAEIRILRGVHHNEVVRLHEFLTPRRRMNYILQMNQPIRSNALLAQVGGGAGKFRPDKDDEIE